MKITYKGDYALKAMLDLALHYNQGVVTINDLAQRIDAPVKFLEQVLSELKKGGFVESKRGKVGGYLLSRPPVAITLGEVVRFIDGPLEPISCVKDGYAHCRDINKCVFEKVWRKVYQATSDIVDNINFEELVIQSNAGKEVLEYSI
jgi:Rrf2 family transcriptional regulator, cysteine metabolism repressor